jgi:hypothetical protein
MTTFRLIGPRRPIDGRTPSERAADMLARLDASLSLRTRSAMTLDAIDEALARHRDVVELLDWPACYFCGAPHPDPGTPCPSCHDGTAGVRSSDTRPVGPLYYRPGGRVIGIR